MEPEVLTKIGDVHHAAARSNANLPQPAAAKDERSQELGSEDEDDEDDFETTSVYEDLLDGEDETYDHVNGMLEEKHWQHHI